tara:strand:+ start:76 stop:360 length:285 start_codon:yes stop_codon:yes gene_type:complete
MNNLIKIQAMHYWVKTFGSTPAIEDYVNYYLDKVGLINVIENDSNYDQPDNVLDYTNNDMQEEIDSMENVVNTFHTEDCESMDELSEQITPSIK